MDRNVQYVEGEDVRRTPFRVALSPLPSLALATRSAFASGSGSGGRGDAIRRHLRQGDLETLAPFVDPGTRVVPDATVGLGHPDETLAHAIERMVATPGRELEDDLAICSASAGDARWYAVMDNPARWLRRYATALLHAWNGLEPVWRVGLPVLEREIERVGVAVALDAQLELVDRIIPDGHVADGRWYLTCTAFESGRIRLPESGMLMTPTIAGRAMQARTGDLMTQVTYPVSATHPRAAEAPAAQLEALLGHSRAQILRALERPANIGRLAELLHAVPSAATHHVRALEDAGLVERERRGRTVQVRRSARGDELVDLYNGYARSNRRH